MGAMRQRVDALAEECRVLYAEADGYQSGVRSTWPDDAVTDVTRYAMVTARHYIALRGVAGYLMLAVEGLADAVDRIESRLEGVEVVAE